MGVIGAVRTDSSIECCVSDGECVGAWEAFDESGDCY